MSVALFHPFTSSSSSSSQWMYSHRHNPPREGEKCSKNTQKTIQATCSLHLLFPLAQPPSPPFSFPPSRLHHLLFPFSPLLMAHLLAPILLLFSSFWVFCFVIAFSAPPFPLPFPFVLASLPPLPPSSNPPPFFFFFFSSYVCNHVCRLCSHTHTHFILITLYY